MPEYVESELFFAQLPPGERQALAEEARLIAHPPRLHPTNAAEPGATESTGKHWDDISD